MNSINDNARYPEGPLWRDGHLFYVECSEHRISRWNGQDNTVFWHEAGSGACALGSWLDDLLLCAYDADELIRIAPDGRTVARRNCDVDGRPFIGPNDLTPDNAGGFFFTASGVFDIAAPIEGAVLHVDAGFRIRRLAGGLHYANGIVFDAMRRRLYVSETLAARIALYDVADDLTLTPAGIFCHLPAVAPHALAGDPYSGGDGMKLDPAGRLLVAHFGTGRLLAIDRDGKHARTIDLPLRYPTNVAIDPATDAVAVTAVADPWHAPFPGAVFHLGCNPFS
jgi:sugar lactone lactonase YvrE